jgi:hypothetical protein
MARRARGDTILPGESFNLDFHSMPYFGEHPIVEPHYLSKRSRRQPSILTFLAQDADSQVFCYSNANLRKGEEADEVFRFIAFWTRHHGSPPRHLVFDSKLTTYAGLDRLDEADITFLTLRRRSPALLREVVNLSASAWRTVTLDLPQHKYKTPCVYEQKVCPRSRTFRQFFIKDLLVVASGLYRLMANRMRGYHDAQAVRSLGTWSTCRPMSRLPSGKSRFASTAVLICRSFLPPISSTNPSPSPGGKN